MYNPGSFKVSDKNLIVDFIRKNSLGILFSCSDGDYYSSHIPFLVNDQCTTLTGHMSRANLHWTVLGRNKVLVVFQGVDHYISPTWYNEEGAVPTWNYVTVHAVGEATIINDEEENMKIVDDLSNFFEPIYGGEWRADWSDRTTRDMLKGIVGFHIAIESLDGKWKLSQNHPKENRESLILKMRSLGDHDAEMMADEMERVMNAKDPNSGHEK